MVPKYETVVCDIVKKEIKNKMNGKRPRRQSNKYKANIILKLNYELFHFCKIFGRFTTLMFNKD